MECGDKSPHSKALPRHRTPKKWCFQGLVSAPEVGEERGRAAEVR